ncbi:MAG: histidinol-phosphate transaminase [Geminicoccaceae bacterium]
MAGPLPRPGILEIHPYIGGKAEASHGMPVAKLSSNESPLGPSPKAQQAYRELAGELHRYPDGGANRLRAALSAYANRDAERIVCGAGSDELISLILQAYAGPGDEVIHSAHGFLMYRLSTLAVGAQPVAAPERDLRASVDDILAAVTSRTKIVFLANPNNPTGTYLPAQEVERLAYGLPDGVLLVLDAAYTEYVEAEDYDVGFDLVDRSDRVVVIRTFSKIFGLAALRLGWAYGPASIVAVLNRVRGPFNTNAPSQAATIAALGDTDHLTKAKHHNAVWLPWLSQELHRCGLEVTASVGNFVLARFGDDPKTGADAALSHFEQGGVLVRGMAAYGLPAWLRISIGLEEENRRVVSLTEKLVH